MMRIFYHEKVCNNETIAHTIAQELHTLKSVDFTGFFDGQLVLCAISDIFLHIKYKKGREGVQEGIGGRVEG